MTILKNDLNHLLNQARVKLPGASDNGIKAELYDVFHEFFDTTSAWHEDILLTVKPNTQSYGITPGEGGQIIRLLQVVDPNLMPQPAILAGPGVIPPQLQPGTTAFPVASEATFQNLLFRNPYTTQQTMVVSVVKNILQSETDKNMIPNVPDFTVPRYGLIILDGVLGKMMSHPSKSYSNDTMGTYHLRRFRDGMAMARVSIQRSNTVATQAWAYPQTFRSRGQRGGISIGSNVGFGI